MQYEDIIRKMTLEEKCLLLSGKDEWHTHDIERLGIPSMMLPPMQHAFPLHPPLPIPGVKSWQKRWAAWLARMRAARTFRSFSDPV